jgi:hypothetical protein
MSEKYYSLNTGIGKTEANVYHFNTNLNKLLFSSKFDVYTSKEMQREDSNPVTDALLLVTVLFPPS